MKRLLFGALISLTLGSQLFAAKAVLVCEKGGVDIQYLSMDCGNSVGIVGYECKKRFKEALKRRYHESDIFDAESVACVKIGAMPANVAIQMRY